MGINRTFIKSTELASQLGVRSLEAPWLLAGLFKRGKVFNKKQPIIGVIKLILSL